MKFFHCLGLLGLLFSIGVSANADVQIEFPVKHQIDRFSGTLTRIQGLVDEAKAKLSFEEKVSYLDSSGVRELLTELQNAIRLYQSGRAYEVLEPYYEATKEFEDLISHVRDFKYFVSMAKVSGDQKAIDKFSEILQKEMDHYKVFLESSDWFSSTTSMTAKITATLNAIQWPSLTEDRDFLLKQMAKRMKKVHEKEYDVNQVELGIHELKRDARRILYLDRATDLLNYFGDGPACPLEQEVPVPTPQTLQTYQCSISSCLIDKLTNATFRLDSIKMNGLNFELKGEPPPASVIAEAAEILRDLKESKVFLHLQSQILSCRSADAFASDKDGEAAQPGKP